MAIGQLLSPKMARVCIKELEEGELFCFPDSHVVYMTTDENESDGVRRCVGVSKGRTGILVSYHRK